MAKTKQVSIPLVLLIFIFLVIVGLMIFGITTILKKDKNNNNVFSFGVSDIFNLPSALKNQWRIKRNKFKDTNNRTRRSKGFIFYFENSSLYKCSNRKC